MSDIDKFNKRLGALKSERSSFLTVYRDLSDFCVGHRGRFLQDDKNKGYRRDLRMNNNHPKMAMRTLASGMASGITSPARPWFQIGAPANDPELAEYGPVKEWMHQVQKLIYAVFNHSNFYNAIHTLYAELGVFGTASMGVYRDFNNVIWCQTETAGSYVIGSDARDIVDTRYKEFQLTVGALVKEFGIENVSNNVKNMWDNGNTEAGINIVHVIEPNDDRDMRSPKASDKKFRSVFYEEGTRDGKVLRRSGFDEFPIVAPRWDIVTGDTYGTSCPGMDALGDIKALQLGEKRALQALDKIVNPPLQAPVKLQNAQRGSIQGGEVIYVDQVDGAITSIYGNWRPDLGVIEQKNRQIEQRISRAFYEDLFLMISQGDRRQITAREIAERQEEKLLMLGPVLERLHSELLDPVIDRTFNILSSAGALPPPPPELIDSELKIEYISILAQAQRMVSTTGIERFTAFAGQMAVAWPEVLNKIDANEVMDEYANSLGVAPKIVRSDDEVQKINEAQQQAQQQQMMMQQAQQMADVAKTASSAAVDENNGLGQMMRQAGLM